MPSRAVERTRRLPGEQWSPGDVLSRKHFLRAAPRGMLREGGGMAWGDLGTWAASGPWPEHRALIGFGTAVA